MSCTPKLRRTELRWGVLTSVLTGGAGVALVLYGGQREWPAPALPFVMFGVSLASHFLDIVVAKRCFGEWGGRKVSVLGFTRPDMLKRLAWYGRSLVSMSFVRFVMIGLLDSLVVARLSEIAGKKLDEWRFGVGWRKLRDPLLVIFIGALTFNLYVNTLRFDWAYSNAPNQAITVLVCMWLVGVIYYQLPAGGGACEGKEKGKA